MNVIRQLFVGVGLPAVFTLCIHQMAALHQAECRWTALLPVAHPAASRRTDRRDARSLRDRPGRTGRRFVFSLF